MNQAGIQGPLKFVTSRIKFNLNTVYYKSSISESELGPLNPLQPYYSDGLYANSGHIRRPVGLPHRELAEEGERPRGQTRQRRPVAPAASRRLPVALPHPHQRCLGKLKLDTFIGKNELARFLRWVQNLT